MSARRPGATTRISAWEVGEAGAKRGEDTLATEEPLEIRLVHGGRRYPVAVTMRTPGADFELAVGFLFNEGILRSRAQLARVSYCVEKEVGEEQRFNIVNVELVERAGLDDVPDVARLERHFSMTSACGVCGKATLEDLHRRGVERLAAGPVVPPEVLQSLPAKLRRAQALFQTTGGLHASGLFSPEGDLVAAREDVGRHNAMDKLVGWAFLNGETPLTGQLVLVSGRSSFELVQKSLSAGVAALCSVSAPSSLAVDLAREFGLTLVGFLREGRFKVYSGAERVGAAAAPAAASAAASVTAAPATVAPAPAPAAPAASGPSSTAPGSTAPGSTAPGSTAPGPVGPVSAGPISAGPVSAGPVSAGPVSGGPGTIAGTAKL